MSSPLSLSLYHFSFYLLPPLLSFSLSLPLPSPPLPSPPLPFALLPSPPLLSFPLLSPLISSPSFSILFLSHIHLLSSSFCSLFSSYSLLLPSIPPPSFSFSLPPPPPCPILQVELACKLGKPLFIHNREAHYDLQAVLASFQDRLPPVLIHCFTGTAEEAQNYIELGYYIGLTGFVCKPERGRAVRELLKDKILPLERLVLETDSPFMLPPLPSPDYNGLDRRLRNNEPCTLPLVAATVAELCGVSVEEVAHTTTTNALSLFRL